MKTKVYISKVNCWEYVTIPAPKEEELQDYYVIDMEEDDLLKLSYEYCFDPDSMSFKPNYNKLVEKVQKVRKRLYTQKTDPMMAVYQSNLIMKGEEGAEPYKQEWIQAKEEIKLANPKPDPEDERFK